MKDNKKLYQFNIFLATFIIFLVINTSFAGDYCLYFIGIPIIFALLLLIPSLIGVININVMDKPKIEKIILIILAITFIILQILLIVSVVIYLTNLAHLYKLIIVVFVVCEGMFVYPTYMVLRKLLSFKKVNEDSFKRETKTISAKRIHNLHKRSNEEEDKRD